MCPVWKLVAVMVMGVATGSTTNNQCWEHLSCQEVNDESSMMGCVQLCRSALTAEEPLIPGDGHLQPPPLPSLALASKRAYSMEHFRWGKPVGKKRRPIKVYSSNSVEEEFPEVFPEDVQRQELANHMVEVGSEDEVDSQKLHNVHEKKDSGYKMKHFRWSGPPTSKRYDDFAKLAGFGNVIKDDGGETTAEQGGGNGGRR